VLETPHEVTRPSWVVRMPRERPRLRLLCFPHAGGGASSFRAWAGLLGPEIEVCAVQPPGREERIREAPITSLCELVLALVQQTAAVRAAPYALFGHSVGALVAFELARALRRRGQPLPVHLFVSGAVGPHVPDTDPPLGCCSDAELLARLRHHRGTPSAILEHPELMELLLPTLRADLSLRDGYRHESELPLDVPITALGGLDDPDVSHDGLQAWREHTRARFAVRDFPGGHFFVRTARASVLSAIESELWAAQSAAAPASIASIPCKIT
jgi:medium-chain acyl-[acyl-carrier-protein] hydrolase